MGGKIYIYLGSRMPSIDSMAEPHGRIYTQIPQKLTQAEEDNLVKWILCLACYMRINPPGQHLWRIWLIIFSHYKIPNRLHELEKNGSPD